MPLNPQPTGQPTGTVPRQPRLLLILVRLMVTGMTFWPRATIMTGSVKVLSWHYFLMHPT